MKRLLVCASLFAVSIFMLPHLTADDSEEPGSPKEALQALNDFIGEWKGTGDVERAKAGSKTFWTEKISWTWRFKKDDVALILTIKNGKLLKSGELRYLTDKKKYQLTATDPKDKKLLFEGELKNGMLTLERTDADKKETQQLSMNVAGDGVRFNYWYKTKPASKKVFNTGYLVAGNKEGESLGGKKEGKECPVSGGLGTIAVSFKGETFYVCCTGCRDAFNENPEKYVTEFKAKQKK
jgi:hypothetical protein